MKSSPLVSVIMSAYNGATHVTAAIKSILGQTFSNFELIAIDDGSPNDDTAAVLRDFAASARDERLRVELLPKNQGLARALNYGIQLARGRYIARQEQDDISLPTRLEAQVRYMEANPDCGLLGTRAEIWVGDERSARAHDHPTDNAALQFELLFNNPFVHSSVMIRRKALDAIGVYAVDPQRQPPEDYELWSRIARRFIVANLPERLLIYREVPNSMSRAEPNPFLAKLVMISAENIGYANGLSQPDQACWDAAALVHAAYGKVSEYANLTSLSNLIKAARMSIEHANRGTNLCGREAEIFSDIRYHFSHRSHTPNWSQPFMAYLRSLPLPAAVRTRLKVWKT